MTEHLTTVFEGELEKKGGGHWSSKFRKRWFQLQCGRTEKRLVYFKGDPHTHDAKGYIDLNAALSIESDEPNKQIMIYTPKRTWVLRAKTIREVQLWNKWMLTESELAQLKSIHLTQRGLSAFLSSMTNLFSIEEDEDDLFDEDDLGEGREYAYSTDSSSTTMTMSLDSVTDSGNSCLMMDFNTGSLLMDLKSEEPTLSPHISELHSADTLKRRITELHIPSETECNIYE